MAKKAMNLPVGYGAAAPKGAAGKAYAKAYAKGKMRKRAARILRKKKGVAGYGYGPKA